MKRIRSSRLLLATTGTALAVGLTALWAPWNAAWADHRPNHNPGGGGGGGGGGAAMLSPVILGAERSCEDNFNLHDVKTSCNAIPVMVTPNGRDKQFIRSPSSAGDLTHGGSPRWVVDFCCDDGSGCTRAGAYNGGSCSGTGVLIATSDDSTTDDPPSYLAVLLDDPDYTFVGFFNQARWSIDGTRVAFSGAHAVDGLGIFVGEVLFDGQGRPAGLSADGVTPNTARLVVNTSRSAIVSWSSDNVRVALAEADDIWTLNVDTAELINITQSAVEERTPAFSPDPGDSRVVFARFMFQADPNNSTTRRFDLFIVDADSPGQAFQLTNESNADGFGIGGPEWSPDAQDIVFGAGCSLSFCATRP